MTDFRSSPEWRSLSARARSGFDLRQAFHSDPGRTARLSFEVGDLIVDLSKHLVDPEMLDDLIAIGQEFGVLRAAEEMFNGAKINTTEDRSVLHTLLRTPRDEAPTAALKPELQSIHQTLDRMAVIATQIRSGNWLGYDGRPISDVVNIGIGGSDLGPAMAYRALRPYRQRELNIHYVSNVDPSHLASTLDGLEPATTLFLVASKTFTTTETLTNARAARRWLLDRSGRSASVAQHFVALSASRSRVEEFGIDPLNMLPFGEWVGGRYSLGSAIGLSLMIAVGPQAFHEMLAGFHVVDRHFRDTPPSRNVPLLMGLLGILYRNAMGLQSYAVLPYSQDLERFPAYLQQLDMESNGKHTRRDGIATQGDTGPVLWGEPGTNGQHAFYQLLHQGTTIVPADLIGFAESHEESDSQQDLLLANMVAQSEALAFGRTSAEAKELYPDVAPDLLDHRTFAGGRPTSVILAPKLTPAVLGQLIALYEHKVFVQGVLWGINSFDQWGVELGKQLADRIFNELITPSRPVLQHDSSTNHLIETLRKARGRD